MHDLAVSLGRMHRAVEQVAFIFRCCIPKAEMVAFFSPT